MLALSFRRVIVFAVLAIATLVLVASLRSTRASSPTAQSLQVPASVILNMLSTDRTISGPGIVEDSNPNATDRFFYDDNGTTVGIWLTVQNLADTSIAITQDGNPVFTVGPCKSKSWEFLTGVNDISFTGQGDGASVRFAWAVRFL